MPTTLISHTYKGPRSFGLLEHDKDSVRFLIFDANTDCFLLLPTPKYNRLSPALQLGPNLVRARA